MRSKLTFALKFGFIAIQLTIIWLCISPLYHSLLAKTIPILTNDHGTIQGVTWKDIYYSSSKGHFYIIPMLYYTSGLVLFLTLSLSSMGRRFAKQLYKVGIGLAVIVASHLMALAYETAIPHGEMLSDLSISSLPKILSQSILLVGIPVVLWYGLIQRKASTK